MMSQAPAEGHAPTMVHSGGQVQPVDVEGGMNGFTAVNGRVSPSAHSYRQPEVQSVQDDGPPLPREIPSRPAGELHNHRHPTNNTGEHMSPSQTNGYHKRKHSELDVEDEERSSDASDRSSESRPTISPDVQMQDASAYPHQQHRSGPEHADGHWNGPDEQAEHFRMLAPIQHENQQDLNGNYASVQGLQNGHGMRPGYHKDEDTGLITTNAGVQMDPKKRKRAFTNRTKTGCQTCRRRKKKCDEGKPECINCTRGGFKCEGYTPRVSWPPENKAKTPKQALPPTQSMPPTPRELQEFTGNLHPRPPPPRVEPQQHMDMAPSYQPNMRPRPMTLDDEPERPVNNSWHYSPYPQPQPSREKDPVHGLPMQPMRDSYDRPISSMSGSSLHTMHSGHPMAPQPSPGIINTAQQALQIPPQQMPSQQMPSHQMASQQMPGQRMAPMGFGHPPAYPEKRNIERQKMVSGELYIHSTPELERDREKCAGLLSTFNGNNHSRADRSHRFDEIIAPEHAKEYNLPSLRAFRNNSKNTIDVPFRCEYGYNIRLGNYVTIEGGCHISDPREVFIDNNSYIGPGVKIIGKVLPADSNIRGDGLEIKARGFKIHIGKSVYIGANSVIQPDPSEFEGDTLTIGDGAYIKPGSVVSKDVPETVVYGPKIQHTVLHGLPPIDERKGRMMR